MDQNIFLKNLIKGKIAEIIFNEMFREAGEFTIIQAGYEHVIPELAQYQKDFKIKDIIKTLKSTPDFVLLSKDRTEVFLIEVKYRHVINEDEIKSISTYLLQRWDPSYLFIATSNKFYMDPCHKILNNSGKISELNESWIKKEIQNKYLILLSGFIK